MKAKKIIAIGLVAAMTLGMSTSVLAQSNYEDYSGYPVFDNFEKNDTFGPDANVFHASGQGWLESSVGLNQSNVNVIVPTRPNIELDYGDPGFFDFGIDPQRLVRETTAQKYSGKVDFTNTAKSAGIYFINPAKNNPLDSEKKRNYYDNSSVEYKALNIGTEDLEFYVSATLSGAGEDFKYLSENDVSNIIMEGKSAYEVVTPIFNAVYPIWAGNTTVQSMHTGVALDEFIFISDLNINQDPGTADGTRGYAFTGEGGVFSDDEWSLIADFKEMSFEKIMLPQSEKATGEELLEELEVKHEQEPTSGIEALLEGWTVAAPKPTKNVGMFMALNVKEEDENGDHAEEGFSEKVLFATSDDAKIADVTAETHLTVPGNPDNYAWTVVDHDYAYRIKADRTEPFDGVKFWFTGVSSFNTSVPKDLKVPSLDFTWRFSKDIPTPPAPVVEAPELVSYNGTKVTDKEFATSPVFNVEEFYEEQVFTGLEMTFNFNIAKVEYSNSASGTWKTYQSPSEVYSINENKLSITSYIPDRVISDDSDRYLRLTCSKAGEDDKYIILKFSRNIP